MNDKRKVLSLIRVSTVQQAKDGKSGIPRQLEEIGIHLRKFNLEVHKELRLEGLSGADVQRSKKF